MKGGFVNDQGEKDGRGSRNIVSVVNLFGGGIYLHPRLFVAHHPKEPHP
jgi:hypothetical protein